jgi:hypothetical protein
MHPPAYSTIKKRLLGLSWMDQYRLLLSTKEWHEFRKSIIERDQNTCTSCGRHAGVIEEEIPHEEWQKQYEEVRRHNEAIKKQVKLDPKSAFRAVRDGIYRLEPEPEKTRVVAIINLQVHHDLYMLDKLPWEYEKRHLRTLCLECHQRAHEGKTMYMYQDESMASPILLNSCGRCQGTGYIPHYYYIEDGICFACGGLGFFPDNYYSPRRRDYD